MIRNKPFATILVAAGILLAGCTTGAVATATPTVPIPTETPVPTDTPTATPEPSSTPTPTATATVVREQARPTATVSPDLPTFLGPMQTYENTTFGVELTLPEDWQLEGAQQPGDPLLVAFPADGVPIVQIFIEFPADLTTPEQLARRDSASLDGDPSISVLDEAEITLGNGSLAYDLKLRVQQLATLDFRLTYATRGTHAVTLSIQSTEENYADNTALIDSIVSSLNLKEPRPAGISPLETLTLWKSSPITLDPALSGDSGSHSYILQIFAGLVRLDHELNVVPDIATWDLNDDGTVYTFHLDKNASFHDGKPVTANDFVYSLNRTANPATGSRTASDFLGDIVGARAVIDGDAVSISGVRAIDDHTLEIEIDAPKLYFLAKMTYPAAYVVDQANVEAGGDSWWSEPNGAGPFGIKQWDEGEILVLERHDGYHGSKARLKNVVFRLYGGIPIRMYENDEIDASTAFLSDLDRIESQSSLRTELVETPELSVFYVGFDTTREPFDDPLVRKAFLMAVDRERIVDSAFDGRLPLADGLLPPGLPGGPNPILPTIEYDPAKALELIGQSSYGSVDNLPDLTYSEIGFIAPSQIAESLVAELNRNLGVNVEIELVPSSERYFNNLDDVRGNLFAFGWVADYPDAQNFLDLLFFSGRENNGGEYSNPDFDALVAEAATIGNFEERLAVYRQAEALLIEEAALIPLRFATTFLLVKPHIDCYQPDGQGLVDFSRVRIQRSVLGSDVGEPCFES